MSTVTDRKRWLARRSPTLRLLKVKGFSMIRWILLVIFFPMIVYAESAPSFVGPIKRTDFLKFFGKSNGKDSSGTLSLATQFEFGLWRDLESTGAPITALPKVTDNIFIDAGVSADDPSGEGAAVLLTSSGNIVAAALFSRPCIPFGTNPIYFNCTKPVLSVYLKTTTKIDTTHVVQIFQHWASQFLAAQSTSADPLPLSVENSSLWIKTSVAHPILTSVFIIDIKN